MWELLTWRLPWAGLPPLQARPRAAGVGDYGAAAPPQACW